MRPGAGSIRISCFQIPDPQKLEGISKCLLFQASVLWGNLWCNHRKVVQYPTALDSGFQLCSANAQKVRWVLYSSTFCSAPSFLPQSPQLPLGSPKGLQNCSSLSASATLFLPFAPSSPVVKSNLAVGFLNHVHTSVLSPFIPIRIVCFLFPTKTWADTKVSL